MRYDYIKQGDCIELMKELPDGGAECVLTDIPYGAINRSSNGLRDLDKGNADITTFDLSVFLKDIIRIARGSIYCFCGTEQVSEIRQTMINAGLSTRLLIWEKTNPSPMNGQYIWLSGIECCVYGKKKGAVFNEHCKNTVFRYPCGRNKLHPTQKPYDLIERLLLASTNEGDLVFDPCMGSGTTCVAAKKTGRHYIGFELDENYFNIAKERIDNAKRAL